MVFQEPRPEGSDMTIVGEPYQGADEYGMPSGHAQSVAFSTTYLYLVTKNVLWLALELCIVALTMIQRWKYKNHSVSQLFVGGLVGGLLGVLWIPIIKSMDSKTNEKGRMKSTRII